MPRTKIRVGGGQRKERGSAGIRGGEGGTWRACPGAHKGVASISDNKGPGGAQAQWHLRSWDTLPRTQLQITRRQWGLQITRTPRGLGTKENQW